MKRIMFIISAMFLVLNVAFGFNMSSTLFDQRIDTGGYREFTIKNDTNRQVRYKIEIKKGDKEGWDMSKWVKVYPKVLSIPPLSEKTVKVYAQSPVGAKEGEYFFNFMATPLVIPTIKSNGKISGTSNLGFVPIIEMMGYVGDPNFKDNIYIKNLKINEVSDGIEVSGTIDNKSIVGINLGITFKDKNGSILDGKLLGFYKKENSQDFKIKTKYISKKENIKQIIIYDSLNIVDLKTLNFI